MASVSAGGSLSVPVDPVAKPGTVQQLTLTFASTLPFGTTLSATYAGKPLDGRRWPETGSYKFNWATYKWDIPDAVPGQLLVVRDVTPVPAPTPADATEDRGSLWIAAREWSGPVEVLPETGVVQWWPAGNEPWDVLRGKDIARRLHVARFDGGSIHSAGMGRRRPPYVHRDPGQPDRVFVRHEADGSSTVFASLELHDVEPVALRPPSATIEAARGSEHVIVATQATLPGAKRLAEHRSRSGLRSTAVAVTDLYEAFSDGERNPLAICRFLKQLRGLKYVVLAGDAVRDRADKAAFETIPALMARTQYNGATPADALYAEGDDESGAGGPVVGRLPFRDAATMDAFVDRLIAYETKPPMDASRRTIRFLANEARFGPMVDRMIEGFFRSIVTSAIPADYDVELTFASAASPYFWPPREFNAKVIDSLNAGALFYTYVGHGFAEGFDSLHVGAERHRVLHLVDVPRVDVKGTPPVVFAIACTTAEFDAPEGQGLGEALMALPHGPIAYYGATRVCHPAANTFLGRALAHAMFRDPGTPRRLGEVLADARDAVLDPERKPTVDLVAMAARQMLPPGTGVTLERLEREAFWLYNLLGDPATRLPLPGPVPALAVKVDGGAIEVEAKGLPDGAKVTFTLEVPRGGTNPLRPLAPVENPADPAQAATIRANHAAANDKVVARAETTVADGRARARLTSSDAGRPLTDPSYGGVFFAKAWVEAPGRLLLGAREVSLTAVDSPDGDAR
jgi:hypothetical protein